MESYETHNNLFAFVHHNKEQREDACLYNDTACKTNLHRESDAPMNFNIAIQYQNLRNNNIPYNGESIF